MRAAYPNQLDYAGRIQQVLTHIVTLCPFVAGVLCDGGVAQMVERMLSMHEAQGSIPCSSTFFAHMADTQLFPNTEPRGDTRGIPNAKRAALTVDRTRDL